ncbi:type II toxin-antitoxin system Phd/YefM family antitoxin [Chlorobaculum thiosulfatiphilum]|jgi:prevent-host-death family protein|uniref:Antitoxin n=1 Tax=Chlorobaculum thiosulfatiphilum TaxID=115852 RepID=A0A5C4SAP1_CHLTI|nr:type II toxin-antitoxin system Phd/YefM family antitoxin [Chlorobaculum thiosulfatiphilum]TNJ40305.1 type II toxin-antitoxin system Phd/YefM family antitoxin [Chlorobaculum thiosulfatiphilum]
MNGIDLVSDIRPLSEFRANTAALVAQVRKTGRPLVLTQHGKSAVVLLDVRHYQSMLSAFEQTQGFQSSAEASVMSGGKES